MSTALPASFTELPLLRGRNPLARRVQTRHGFPVLPGGFPVVGHMPAIAVDTLGLLREGQRRFGSLFFSHQGFDDWHLVYASNEAFSLFKSKALDSSYLTEGGLGNLFGQTLMAHDGASHRHIRTAMNGPFSPKGLDAAEVGAIVAASVERKVRSWLGRRDVLVLRETRELALEVMFKITGVVDDELPEWRHHYEDLMLLILNLPFDVPGSPRRRGLRAGEWLDARIRRILADVRARGEAKGLLPALLKARDEDGQPLSEQDLVGNLRLLLLAGHETSASTMAWCVAHLAESPAIWRALREEATSAPDLPRSPADLRRFPFAEAVFREALRLHPPVHQDARRAAADFELEGRTVPRGTIVAIPLVLLSRDPELYPDPDSYRPERWLGRKEAISPLEISQFGGGAHFCLGYHLAWMEIVQFLVALGRLLPASGPRLQGGFPASRYLPVLRPAAGTRVRFDG
ncbi:cytochrome P450 [Sorangium sp. So ce1389]|uniref:cytochrome P450 n=1 Tax=Sorangium sp. So ce1389 TaxID=3133336 RepID=UPI003F62BB43